VLPPADDARNELRVIDQTLTGYSMLRDTYARRAATLSIILLFSGVLLLLLSFGSGQILGLLGWPSDRATVLTAILGGVVFATSLADMRLGWAPRAALYGAAADRYAGLKALYRNYLHNQTPTAARTTDLRERHQALGALGPGIPERDFLRLKQAHLRKVQLSQMLDQSPGTPIAVLKWRLFVESLSRMRKRQ
jgi:hypothetical protein